MRHGAVLKTKKCGLGCVCRDTARIAYTVRFTTEFLCKLQWIKLYYVLSVGWLMAKCHADVICTYKMYITLKYIYV